jgi:hypothetical protein
MSVCVRLGVVGDAPNRISSADMVRGLIGHGLVLSKSQGSQHIDNASNCIGGPCPDLTGLARPYPSLRMLRRFHLFCSHVPIVETSRLQSYASTLRLFT